MNPKCIQFNFCVHVRSARTRFITVWRNEKNKPQSISGRSNENDSKTIHSVKQPIKALLKDLMTKIMKASLPQIGFAIQSNLQQVVLDEMNFLSNSQFQEIENKGTRINEITER